MGAVCADVVRVTRLELVRHKTHAPQTCLSANSSTLARGFAARDIVTSSCLYVNARITNFAVINSCHRNKNAFGKPECAP